MPPENVHDRKEKRHFTFIVVPSGESSQTRSFSISQFRLIGSAFALLFVTIAIVVALFAFTPVGYLLPVSNPELERRYGTQIRGIQEQVSHLVQDMTVLRGYNLKLRKALGENVTGADSLLAAKVDAVRAPAVSASVATRQEIKGFGDRPVSGVNPREGISSAGDVGSDPGRGGNLRPAADLPLVSPAEGYISRGFDLRHSHYGTDFAGKKSSGVLAAAEGRVAFSGWTYDDGFVMMLAHDRGYITVYKHNEALLKSTGSAVKRGELIALLGSTGKTSSGPHLHFEVWKDGTAYDPEQFLLTTRNKE